MNQTLNKTFLIFLMIVFCVAPSMAWGAERSLNVGDASKSSKSLKVLVETFLSTNDMALAEEFLVAILSSPDASVDRVAALIHSGPRLDQASVGHQPRQVVQVRGKEMSYGLFVPPAYKPNKSFPLVVCLHGAGFTGDSYLERWAARLGDAYILACPTIPMGMWWSRVGEELVLATMSAVQNRYHIDPNRIYLTGMSNGGIGAWIIGMHYAPRFAAVAPMASGVDEVLYPFLSNLRHTPLYVIHGSKDKIMPVWLSRDITNALAQLGIGYVYREHEWSHPHAGGHFFPRQELPVLVEWFGQQRRERYPFQVTVVRDASHLSEFNWVRIDSTDRIAMFSEQLIDRQDDLIKDGVFARLDVDNNENNRIEVNSVHVRRYTLFFNDVLIDFSQPLTVVTNGVISFEGMMIPDLEVLLWESRRRQDRSLEYAAKLTVDVPSSIFQDSE